MQAGVIDEMMDDMMDSAMDEPDLEQETEEEVDKVSMQPLEFQLSYIIGGSTW